MKQIIFGKTYGQIGSGTPCYATIRAGSAGAGWTSAAQSVHAPFALSHPWSVAGMFTNLYVQILAPVESSAVIAWTATTFELYINDAPSGLAVTVPAAGPVAQNGFAAAASNLFTSVTVAPGDVLSFVKYGTTITGVVNGLSACTNWSMTFQSTNAKESGYGSGSASVPLGNSNIHVCAPFNGDAQAFFVDNNATTDTQSHSIVPVAGDLFRLDVRLDTAPGVGQSRVFVAVKNGVPQDGSGGTPDTTLTISETATTGFSTFTLPLVPLNLLSVYQLIPSGSPASALGTMSVGFRATTDGQSALCFDAAGATAITDGSSDFAAGHESGWAWTTAWAPVPAPAWYPTRYPCTELLISLPGSIDPFTLSGMCVNLSAAPGSGNSCTYTTRQALATPGSGPIVTMGATDVLATGTGSADFTTVADRLDIQAVGTSSPAAAHVGWAWLMTAAAAPPPPPTVVQHVLRRVRRFPFPAQGNKMMFLARVELLIQAGEGLTPGAASDPPVLGSDPIIMFRLSRDGGQTWGQELQMGIGKQGAYTYRAYLNRLGRGRNLVGEVSCTDPIPLAFLDCVADLEVGTS